MLADTSTRLRFLAGGKLAEIDEQRAHPRPTIEVIREAGGGIDAAAMENKDLCRLNAAFVG